MAEIQTLQFPNSPDGQAQKNRALVSIFSRVGKLCLKL
jgi:hypothetical protein